MAVVAQRPELITRIFATRGADECEHGVYCVQLHHGDRCDLSRSRLDPTLVSSISSITIHDQRASP